jgi:pterin-4a-carbinolamine dehydratase
MRPAYEVANERSGFVGPGEVEDAIRSGWRLERDQLVRDLGFRDFEEAMAFALELGRTAVDFFRRPDMFVRSHLLTLQVGNPHHAGFTVADMRLVHKADAAIARQSSAGGGASA